MSTFKIGPRLALAARIGLGALLFGGVAFTVAEPAAFAQAAPVFEGKGLIEILRPTDLIGDGGSPTELFLLALDPAGKPITDWKVKLSATGGTVSELADAGGGLHRFTFTPMKSDGLANATIEAKIRLGNKEGFSRSWTIPVSPSRAHPMKLAASPPALTLGTDKTANVEIAVTGGEPAALAQVKLAHALSVGTLTNLTHLGGGQFTGLYTAPTVNVPQVALVTAVDAGDPTRGYGAVAIPLAAKVDQAVQVPAGASVLLKVGGRDFGPVTADSKGRAKVPVVVPAGTTTATRITVVNGVPTEEPFPLSVPETRRLALFPTSVALPADGRLQVPVRVFVVTPDGRPDESAQVELAASAGTVSAVRHEGGGIYVATYAPPHGNAATKATLTAKLAGGSKAQVDTRDVPLVPTRATGLALTADPPALPAGATSLAVVAKVTGPDGAALAGRTLKLAANGAKLAEVKDLKNGEYRAAFTPTGKGPVEVTAAVAAPPTQNPLARVVVLPARERLPPDGLSSAMLTVATVDEFGSPVAGVLVELRVVSGDGSVPATATTDAAGVAQIYYTAGRKNGLVGIDVVAGDRTAGVTLIQAPPDLALPDLPMPTSAATRALADELAATTATIRIERQ